MYRPRHFVRLSACVLLTALLLAFPYGPLFPWSPWTPGFDRLTSGRAELLYPAGSQPGDWSRRLDEYIQEAERFHALPMPRRITVVECGSWSDFRRFMPQLGSRGPGAVVLFTGTAVYLTPLLAETQLDKGEYVRHELAHAIVHQNQNLLDAVRVSEQPWLFEGMAVCFGRQKSYVSPEEFVARAPHEDLESVIDPEKRARANPPADMRFSYQTWRYFLEHLMELEGRERFLRYFKTCVGQPEAAPRLFGEAYGLGLASAIRRFQSDLRAGKWRPHPDFVESQLAQL